MQAAESGRQRSLQSLSTTDGLVIILEPGDQPGALDVLGAYVSAVGLTDTPTILDAIDTEAVPGSVGFIGALAETTATDLRALGAAAGVVRLGPSDPSVAELGGQVSELRRLGLAAIVDCGSLGGNADDPTDRLLTTIEQVALADPDLIIVPFPVDPSIDDSDVWGEACARIDEACSVPWLLAVRNVPFALGLRHVRSAALAGSSGCVLGERLWDFSDQPGDDTLARGLQLIAAQRRALTAWDALSEDPDSGSDSARWFGVRTFVHHPDVSRLEERVVVHRADSQEAALALGLAESEEYAAAFDCEPIDAAQVYELSLSEFVEAAAGGFAAGVEVYSQMRPVSDDGFDTTLDTYFD